MYGTLRNNYGLDNPDFCNNVKNKISNIFYFATPFIVKDNIILSSKEIDRFKDKKILVIGGGKSTNEYLDKIDYQQYDSIWSINNFYKNNFIFNNLKIDLFSVGPEVDLKDIKLINYINNNDTIAAFELHEKWARNFNNTVDNRTPSEIKEELYYFVNSIKFVTSFQTKFYSQLGGGARLLIFAAEIGVSNIDIIGFDGPKSIISSEHSFEKGKSNLPSYFNSIDKNTIISIFQQQYDFFWLYFKRNYINTKIKTLAENEMHRNL